MLNKLRWLCCACCTPIYDASVEVRRSAPQDHKHRAQTSPDCRGRVVQPLPGELDPLPNKLVQGSPARSGDNQAGPIGPLARQDIGNLPGWQGRQESAKATRNSKRKSTSFLGRELWPRAPPVLKVDRIAAVTCSCSRCRCFPRRYQVSKFWIHVET